MQMESAGTPEATDDLFIAAVEQAELIAPDQEPTEQRWVLPLLEKTGNDGLLHIWQVGYDGQHLKILHGNVDTYSVEERVVVTNSSGKDRDKQALQEARYKHNNKVHEGYQDPEGEQTVTFTKAMKGYPYKEGDIKNWPVLVSPKFNGIRLLCRIGEGGEIDMRSYLNRTYNHLKSIRDEMGILFRYLPKGTMTDGELYNSEMTLQQISSAVKTVKRIHPDQGRISYCLFDIATPDNPPSEIRVKILEEAFQRFRNERPNDCHLHNVQHTKVNDHSELMEINRQAVQIGYEGLVIRLMANGSSEGSNQYEMSRYKTGRSRRIFKVKNFHDEETTVIDVIPARNEKDACKLLVRGDDGYQIPIRFGTMEEKRLWFRNPHLVKGKRLTIRYPEKSVYGIPQQAVGVAFRDYE